MTESVRVRPKGFQLQAEGETWYGIGVTRKSQSPISREEKQLRMLRRILTRKAPARSELRKVAEARRQEEPLDHHGRVMEFVDQRLVRRGWVTLAEIEAWEVRQNQRATAARQIRKWLAGIGLMAATPENPDRWVKEAEDEAWLAAWD